MARLARIVAPHTPHLITQRGNRDMDVFFSEEDAAAYIELMGEQCERFGVEIQAWCLLKSRVHLLAVPSDESGLGQALGEAHRRYTNRINEREGWNGHLWASRFSSFPMDEAHVLHAAHFIEMTPVMEGLCKQPDAFRWSSAKAHLKGEDDGFCNVNALLNLVPDWSAFLKRSINIGKMQAIAGHIRTGRPLGSTAFIEQLEEMTGRTLKKQRPGRKPKGTPPRKIMRGANNNKVLHQAQKEPVFKISEQDLAALIDSGSAAQPD